MPSASLTAPAPPPAGPPAPAPAPPQLADLNPYPILCFDEEGQPGYANEAARQLRASLDPAGQASWDEQLRLAARHGIGEEPLVAGSRYFRGRVVPLPAPATGVALYLAESTEQQLTKGQFLGQLRLMELVLDTTPQSVFVRNADGEIVFENRATTEVRALTGYLHPTDAQAPTAAQQQEQASYHATDQRVLRTGQQVTTESSLTLASGEQRWFRTVKRLLVRPDGERQVLSLSTDITAQRWALRGLEQREKQYRDLMTYSQALIFTHDLAGQLLSLNPAGAALLGRPAEQLVGGHLANVSLPAYRAEVNEYLHHVATQGGHRGVMALKAAGGSTRYLLYHSHLVREDGQAPYVIGYGQDITERIGAERALRQAKEAAEAAVLARENFLANMSHEIRTPLNGVLGMAAQLSRTLLDGRQQEFVSTIRTAGQHLLRVLNDVLDMAKITSGKLELESVAFNLCDSMAEATKPLAAQAEEKGVHLSGTRLKVSCPHPWVLGDPFRLSQILLNLLSNAIKFTEPGGHVTVVGELLSEDDSTITVRFSVADTGIGIAPDKQEDIFASFTQAYADTTRRFGGTGLGLSISRALVAQLGGTLTLESELGKGSTFAFTLTLPKAPVPAAEPTKLPYDTGALRSRRVLVVEDNEINRTVIRLLLEDWGVTVEEAPDGRAGLARVAADAPYDVVLMDVQMPGLNGLDATAAIRALPDAARAATPIVALTANAFVADRERCLAAGMQACLAKPFEEEEVYRTLTQVIPATGSYDLSRLRTLARGRQDFVQKIILSFLRNVPGSLTELREAANLRNWLDVAKIVHHIKPSLESLSVSDVADAIQLLEAAPLDRPADLRAAAATLLAQVQRVLAELPKELAGKG